MLTVLLWIWSHLYWYSETVLRSNDPSSHVIPAYLSSMCQISLKRCIQYVERFSALSRVKMLLWTSPRWNIFGSYMSEHKHVQWLNVMFEFIGRPYFQCITVSLNLYKTYLNVVVIKIPIFLRIKNWTVWYMERLFALLYNLTKVIHFWKWPKFWPTLYT